MFDVFATTIAIAFIAIMYLVCSQVVLSWIREDWIRDGGSDESLDGFSRFQTLLVVLGPMSLAVMIVLYVGHRLVYGRSADGPNR